MDNADDEVVARITARYVAELRAGERPQVSTYIRRYPAYADAISDFIAYYHAVELPSAMEHQQAAGGAQAQVHRNEHGGSLLHNGSQPLNLSQYASLLDLSVDLLLQLERRRIDSSSLPSVLYRRLSEALACSEDEVVAYLRNTSDVSASRRGGRQKVAEHEAAYVVRSSEASSRPTFLQAVEASPLMDEEQKRRWRQVIANATKES